MRLLPRGLGLYYIPSILRSCRRVDKALAYPEMFDDYEAYHEATETGNANRVRVIAELIEPHSVVADVGCGGGDLAHYIKANLQCSVIGVDVSETAAAKTRRLGIEVIVQDVNAGLQLPGAVDYIVLSEVIEHLPTPQKVLLDSIRQARKGVIVTIPNSGWLPWRMQLLRGHCPRQSFTHLHSWTHADFPLFCQQLGFRITRFNPVVPPGLIGGWLVRHLPNMFAYQLCYLLRS